MSAQHRVPSKSLIVLQGEVKSEQRQVDSSVLNDQSPHLPMQRLLLAKRALVSAGRRAHQWAQSCGLLPTAGCMNGKLLQWSTGVCW